MSSTISEEYLKLQRALHANPDYGEASLTFAPLVAKLVRAHGVQSICDYGAGKLNLLRGLREVGIELQAYYPYDPVFPEYGIARPADLVCCIDVLEHVEPDRIDSVIFELAAITTKLGFFTVHMGPAIKHLADGRNAHLIQMPASWWLRKFVDHFEVNQLQAQAYTHHGSGFWVLVSPSRE